MEQILRQGQGGSFGMQKAAYLLACHTPNSLPTYLATYLHLMLGGPVDSLNCPFQDICFRMTYSCHLVGQTRSCLMLQGIPSRQIMAGVIEMFGLAVSVKAEGFESASTCGQPGL